MSNEESRVIVDSHQTLTSMRQDSLALVHRVSQIHHQQLSYLNSDIVFISEKYKSKIEKAERSEEIYFHIANMEKDLSKLINEIAEKLQKSPQQFEIPSITNTLKELSELMTAIDLCLAQHVREVINEACKNKHGDPIWLKMEAIVNKIGEPNLNDILDDIESNKVASENLRAIMNKVTNLAISAITKEITSQAGKDYISQLHKNIGKDNLLFTTPYITTRNTCIGVIPAHAKKCYANLTEKASADSSLCERMINTFSSNDGHGSYLTVPITVPKESYGKLEEYFSQDGIVDKILYTLMNRNIFVDDSGARYTPFQVELYHELIHVLHNAQGQNLYFMPMSTEEKKVWSSYEEYVTIKGGYPCEADFAVLYGAHPRTDHSNGKEIQLFLAPNSQSTPDFLDHLDSVVPDSNHTSPSPPSSSSTTNSPALSKQNQQNPLGKMMHFAVKHPCLTAGAIGLAVGLAVAALAIGTMGVGLSAAASCAVGAAATGVSGSLTGVVGNTMYNFFKPKQSTENTSRENKVVLTMGSTITLR